MDSRTRWLIGCLALLLAGCGPAAAPRAGLAATPAAPATPSAVPGAAGAASPVPAAGPGTASAPAAAPSAADSPSLAPPAALTSPAAPGAPTLTPDQLAGQRVVYSYQGATVPESLLTAVRSGRAAGVIFFGANTADPVAFQRAVAALRQAQRQSPVQLPLLLMTDQEGGQIRRLAGAPDLSAQAIGRSTNPQAAAAEAGSSAARNLSAAGLNVNLAPVLDVYARDGDFIDATQRSYSDDPTAVASLGSAFITAQQQAGVAATAKHFPGLGTAPAGANTDQGPVTLTVSRQQLAEADEAPYPAAIGAGVDLVMVSWAVYPALDPDHPAGLSPAVVGGELRDRLGFHGVTVTDALEAGALKAYGGTGQRAVAAAHAGMDLLLCSAQDPDQGQDATTALADALTTGRLDRTGFAAAVARVNALRAGLH
ncbi:beta-N-acetylhexosaminidase [Kitasatospora sp. NBC_01287]|uniref:glycoside hydrolase family 3 N-terminal domain-containing protein n=1 Tax=Kitasatospora sp. NBC_01287 TaxID=2903573 RepID=UPI0022585F61|nr:glycoside hydrolase family 3 N-terminal domain-containing protein [Kitasatospora sp. NBC_01287]MCX4744534.1 beta-N-acetylhexosaminidase [Kitasatospora sp. NBC_01287]